MITKIEQKNLIKIILQDFKKELMLAMIQESLYQKEYIKPTHITKSKAEEALATYQKRIAYIEDNIKAVELYIKDYDL